MRKSYLVILLFIVTNSYNKSSAQNPNEFEKDSLLDLLASSPDESELDTIYLQIGNWYLEKNAELAASYYDSALNYALKTEGSGSIDTTALGDIRDIENPGNIGLQIRTIHQLGQIAFANYKYSQANNYFETASVLASSNGFDSLLVKILPDWALSLKYGDQRIKGIRIRQQLIALMEDKKEDMQLALSYFELGQDYYDFGKVDSANWALVRAKHLAIQNKDRLLLGRIENTMANILADAGRLVEALSSYQAALKIAEEFQDPKGISTLNANMGLIHHELENYLKAEEYLLRTLDLHKESFPDRLHQVYFSLAYLYEDWEKYEMSLIYNRKTLEELERVGLKEEILSVIVSMTNLHFLQGQLDSSEYYMRKGEPLLDRADRVYDKITANIIFGKINVALGHYSKAERQLKQAYGLSKERNALNNLSVTAEKLYELFKETGDYEKALLYHEEYKQLRDSLINEDQIRQITKLEETYLHEKELLAKENEIELLETKSRLTQFRQLLLLAGAMFLLIVGFLIARARIRSKSQQAQHLRAISQFKESMTGMIAHDLKNPLSVIMGNHSENPTTRRMAGQMLHLVHNMLDVHKLETTEVQLNKGAHQLLVIVNEAVEQVRPLLLEKNILLLPEVRDDVVVEVDHEYLVRVFENFLTNAIKYSSRNSTIEVTGVVQNEKMVSVSIMDHGKGIAPQDRENIFDAFYQIDPRSAGKAASSGLGLSFCQLVLKAHGSDITVDSEVGSGTTFSFDLELANHDDSEMLISASGVRMTSEERQTLSRCVPRLREVKLHHASEIEQILGELGDPKGEASAKWVESILMAAYNNNQKHFNELLDEVEMVS